MAFRSTLGVLAGRMKDSLGCDDMFVAVAVRAVLRGVPGRDDEISISSRKRNEDTSHEIIGAVLCGGYGLDIGTGAGNVLVCADVLCRARDCAKRFTSGSLNYVRCSARAAHLLKAVPIVFRNVGTNSSWHEAVLTVVY